MRSAKSQAGEITLRLPLPVFVPELVNWLREVPGTLAALQEDFSRQVSAGYRRLVAVKAKFPATKFNFRQKPSAEGIKKRLPMLILFLVIIGAMIIAVRAVRTATTTPPDTRISIQGPIAIQILNKEVFIPIKDDKGVEVTKAKFLFDTAELRNEIIVNGQKAEAVKGRTFLILNIKITNSYDKSIELSVRDFARLSVNGNDQEWVAADIHNDPVNVRPASTKITRLGFPINDTDKKLVLRLGDITGEKQTVALNFHK